MTEDTDALRPWLELLHTPGVGPVLFRDLLQRFGSPQRVLSEASRRDGIDPKLREALRNPDREGVEQDLRWLEAEDTWLLTCLDPAYPAPLNDIAGAPPLLFGRGDMALLATPQLAVVGSRNPTPAGAETARDFARHLATSGLTITSGLALGIDGAAHRGALEGGGQTIAVMGTGPDRVYPARHRELAHAIVAEGGALISEFPPGTGPYAGNFPRRNRVISGLSLGVLVVEAALRSGSLITARQAAEQGREVLAIPGSIHNPLARGCHRLIRDGAKLVETADDILEELAPQLRAALQAPSPEVDDTEMEPAGALDEEYRQLLEFLGYEPTPVDLLVERSGLTADAVSSMLLLLELQGYVVPTAGGRYSRTNKRA